MTMTDPIADMLTRIRNGLKQNHAEVSLPASKLKQAVLNVLIAEGYILGSAEETDPKGHKHIKINLKYHQGRPVISMMKRVSTPGRRVYSACEKLPMVANGLGITIVSTSKGVMTDTQARAQKIGGEIICQVS